MVAPEDFEPQVDPEAPAGTSQDAAAPQAPDPAVSAPEPAVDAPSPGAEAEGGPSPADGGASDAPTSADETTTQGGEVLIAGGDAPADEGRAADEGQPAGDGHAAPEDGQAAGSPATTEGGQAAGGDPEASADQPAGDAAPAEGATGEAPSEGGAPKKRRRSRGKRSGRGGAGGGPGGKRRFAWDEVFLRQRLELLRAMDPDPEAIAWAVQTAGRFEVADILAGEGSSGREFGRRAYGAAPETDDQAAWIVLAAVRARDIVSIARRAVSGTQDQREQVRAAIDLLGIARVNTALQGDRPAQQVYAERARRVDVTVSGGEDQKAAWALLSLARPQDVSSAAAPRRPARPGGPGGPGGPGRGGPGGPGGFGGDRRGGRERREPPIPGGVFSVGESGIGGELGAKLRAALAAAEGESPEAADEAQDPQGS